MSDDRPITDFLEAWRQGGDREALDELVVLLYAELKELSRRAMAKERPSHTLQPTALINEVYLRLLRLKKISFEGRGQFLAFAGRIIRRVLVDHARARQANKRGGQAQRIDLDLTLLPDVQPKIDLLLVDDLLSKLETEDPLLVKIIELRFFSGLTEREIAEALGISRTRTQKEWKFAKRWLASQQDRDTSKD